MNSSESSQGDSSSQGASGTFTENAASSLAAPVCTLLPDLPMVEAGEVRDWVVVPVNSGSTGTIQRGLLKVRTSEIYVVSGSSPVVLDTRNLRMCVFDSPSGGNNPLFDLLPIRTSQDFLAVFSRHGASPGRLGKYQAGGTLFQNQIESGIGDGSKLVEIAKTSTALGSFGSTMLQRTTDYGERWEPIQAKGVPYNFHLLADRSEDFVWSFNMSAPDRMLIFRYPTRSLDSTNSVGTFALAGSEWPSYVADAAVSDPHRSAAILLGSSYGTERSPVLGRLSVIPATQTSALEILWKGDASSAIDSVTTIWPSPDSPDRFLVGGRPRSKGSIALVVVEGGVEKRSIPLPVEQVEKVFEIASLSVVDKSYKDMVLVSAVTKNVLKLFVVSTKPLVKKIAR